jgi:hypothetical protein
VKQNDAIVAYAVVNVDPRESDTRPLAVENLKPGEKSAVTVLHGEEEVATGEKVRDYWPQLAIAAVVFLAAEMLLLALWRKAKTKPAEAAS